MPRTNVHLSGRETDSALLKMYGLETDESKKVAQLAPITCRRCQQNNDPSARFCAKCGLPLRIEAALEVDQARKQSDELMDKLLDDPEVRELLLRKLTEMTLKKQLVPELAQPAP
jgi:ribosomal protein L40E